MARELAKQLSEHDMAGEIRLKRWDSAAHLKTDADIARYWEACLEEL